MKRLKISLLIVVMYTTNSEAQSWGYGLYGGLSGCGYKVTEAEESSSYKDEISELKKQMSDWKKEISQLKRDLSKEQSELHKNDSILRNQFDSDAYDFIKTHFDGQVRCLDYQGQSPKGGPTQEIELTAIGKNSKIGKTDEFDAEEKEITSIEPKQLAQEWADVCDLQDNPRGKLKNTICQKRYLLSGFNHNQADCRMAILNYPKSVKRIQQLERDVESKQDAIKSAMSRLSELQKDMKEEQAEARKQRQEESKEGGVCLECLASSGGQQPEGFQSGQSNLGGVIGNSVMALMAYSSTKNFYGTISDKNADLGIPTQMPLTSPFMAASPYIMGAIGAGLGQGSFGCAGNAGGIGGLSGAMGPFAAIGGSGQIGGAFGTPQWAMGNQLGGGMYNQGFGSWGGNGPWGLNSMGMSQMNPYSSLLGGNNYGLAAGLGGSGMMGVGSNMYGLTGLSGMNGLGGLSSFGGLSGISGMGSLYGLNGMSGLSGLGGLDSGMQSQMVQMQLQQQQQLMQNQMRVYENAIQKQKAISGLQTELMGVIQRINSIQSGTSYLGTSTNYYGIGSNYTGGYTTTSSIVPTPIGSR